MKENKQALREPEQKNVEGDIRNNLCVPHSNPQCDRTHCGVVRVTEQQFPFQLYKWKLKHG